MLVALVANSLFGLALSCDRGGSKPASEAHAGPSVPLPEGGSDILATVNGVPISERDVRYRSATGRHKTQMTPQGRRNVLETVIREELFRQRAVELGLDGDPRYQQGLRELEARVNAFARAELSRLFIQRETKKSAVVSEEDARKYFVENESRIKTELHLWQILKKGRKHAVEQALQEIRNGTPFEQVAAAQFPALPKAAGSPWDLGYLRWQQVPAAWRDVVYDLKEGEMSEVIRGAGERFWIVKLIDRRENPQVTFESVRPTIIEVLRSEAAATVRERAEGELRNRAKIVYHEARGGVVEE